MDNLFTTLLVGFPLLIFLVALLFLGGIGGLIGRARGRGTSGFLWGLFLGPIGWLIVAVQKDLREEKALTEGSMKKCPQCAELVKAEAKKCRFCGHEFESSGSEYTCSDCGSGVSKEDMVCPKCGADISELDNAAD